MGIAPDLTTSLEALRGVQVPDDMPAGDAVEAMTCVVTLRNVIDHLAAMHGLSMGGTSADGRLTVEAVYCLGNCALGPSALVEGELIGRVDADRVAALCGGRQ